MTLKNVWQRFFEKTEYPEIEVINLRAFISIGMYRNDSSGEPDNAVWLRNTCIKPLLQRAIENKRQICFDLDTISFSAAFLEEMVSGLYQDVDLKIWEIDEYLKFRQGDRGDSPFVRIVQLYREAAKSSAAFPKFKKIKA